LARLLLYPFPTTVNIMKIKYLAAALITLAGLGLTQRADAAPLEMTYNDGSGNSSQYLLGTVIPGTQGGGGQAQRDATMTNALLALGLGGQVNNSGLYSRSFNNFGSLPAATATGALLGTNIAEGTTPVTVNLGTGFQYLVAVYDGPNGGVAVFNVAGLTGSVDLYRYAKPLANGNLLGSNVAAQGYFKMTGWTLLNPTGAVPDGGTTVMLLGAALGGLGMARRFLKI
jgi:protein with PEP-CTERM/exosortase system signal